MLEFIKDIIKNITKKTCIKLLFIYNRFTLIINNKTNAGYKKNNTITFWYV